MTIATHHRGILSAAPAAGTGPTPLAAPMARFDLITLVLVTLLLIGAQSGVLG